MLRRAPMKTLVVAGSPPSRRQKGAVLMIQVGAPSVPSLRMKHVQRRFRVVERIGRETMLVIRMPIGLHVDGVPVFIARVNLPHAETRIALASVVVPEWMHAAARLSKPNGRERNLETARAPGVRHDVL